ncbi:cysteine--tRNA ligase [Bacillus horti]|uniref:Cysteine--tRNA ligase n=1 Tax=Caldalkalibacillus horti TaxID=77523 RepID=A0ABT9VYH0_9BACI|nr:cysteine--tRNA ligase [Bacillus horti]MDQ0166043.1 cysteinyl-tRNA synthetase [Bacillus horti]
MSIRIYNTLTRKKEEFVPLEPGKVKMYVCGPTVYNHIHIGNTRPAIFFDTVRRYLIYKGYDVQFVSNFTDVDDRIIQAGIEQGISAQEVAELYIDSYHSYTSKLGVQKADEHPRVTENMNEIVDFIDQLVQKGIAYEANGDVYYRTNHFDDYGKLSHQKTSELFEGVRIGVGEAKESPTDFTLWKKAKPQEVSWDSPWGQGRPGWHIECSSMIRKYLGDTIDIHGGGIDLVFPHHENEIAQTEALTEKPLANYWMHNAMLNIDNQKMSKSLGNFVRVNDVLAQHDPQVVRFFMLSGQYRSPINFSDLLLDQASNGFDRLKTVVANLAHRFKTALDTDVSEEQLEQLGKWKAAFEEAMNDDFNTAAAISVLFELTREINTVLQEESAPLKLLQQYHTTLLTLAGVLGIVLAEEPELLDADIEQLIEERQQARRERNFARADEIRDQLSQQGIILEDTPQGMRWRRK